MIIWEILLKHIMYKTIIEFLKETRDTIQITIDSVFHSYLGLLYVSFTYKTENEAEAFVINPPVVIEYEQHLDRSLSTSVIILEITIYIRLFLKS